MNCFSRMAAGKRTALFRGSYFLGVIASDKAEVCAEDDEEVFMRMVLTACALLLASSGAFAQKAHRGWKTVAVNGTSCRYAVPVNWTEDTSRAGMAQAPDEKSTIVPVSMPKSFADAKKAAAQKMPPAKVLQNSAQRYWFVYRDPADGEDSPDTHWFVAVPGKDGVCAFQITFRSATGDALPKRIVRTIRSSK
jgi:hypothetical protein